jgi:two-component system cell cycle response regulator DivK
MSPSRPAIGAAPVALTPSERMPCARPVSRDVRRSVVLVVDDQRENCDLYREYLTLVGFDVIEAHDGGEGIQAALDDAPDVIVMDLAMPIVDGYTATRRLKSDPRTRDIPVVVVTASGVDCYAEAIEAGCDAFLMKPCLPDDLERVLHATIARARVARDR